MPNSYSTCLGDVQSQGWRHVTKNNVKQEVAGKKKGDMDKRDCVTATEQETSVGLKAPKRKDFCCSLCDKYVIFETCDKYELFKKAAF